MTKREARAFAASVEVLKVTGGFIPTSAGHITVSALAPQWLMKKKQSTARSHYRMLESAWRVHVEPAWANRRIVDITPTEVEAWIANMISQRRGVTTVRRAHSVLSGILADGLKSRRLAVNPAAQIDNLPRPNLRRHTYLTGADVHRLADESGRHRQLVLVLAFCGLRWGEAIALRVGDMDLLRHRLVVSANVVQLTSEFHVGPTKDRRMRSVPIPAFLLDELSRLCVGKARDELVFAAASGGYLPRPRSGNGWFASAVRRAGLPQITPHDLRHTCASLAVSAGASVLALQRMLGHTSAKLTLDVYADLFDSDLDNLARSLDTAYSPQGVRNGWARAATPDSA